MYDVPPLYKTVALYYQSSRSCRQGGVCIRDQCRDHPWVYLSGLVKTSSSIITGEYWLKRVVMTLCPGVGESFPRVWPLSKPAAVQHHKGRRAVGVLGRTDGTSRLQAETLQDQDESLDVALYTTSRLDHTLLVTFSHVQI